MTERLLTPQQEAFLAYYTNPQSETFGNALQSALKAGYAQEYSESITSQMPEWLSENLGSQSMLIKAEKVLHKTLDYRTEDDEGKVDAPLLKTQTDVAKFVAKALNKAKWSERKELTGKDGERLIPERREEIEQALEDL